ncbi:hypothetical protein ABT168_39755, partial [Streptomyces sp. NPDC001793]|uniref:hypothetical protein n=1 Tax=Streptomyces sp. NPDC001793 TaxID=3154657 RepID=UPI00332CE439
MGSDAHRRGHPGRDLAAVVGDGQQAVGERVEGAAVACQAQGAGDTGGAGGEHAMRLAVIGGGAAAVSLLDSMLRLFEG